MEGKSTHLFIFANYSFNLSITHSLILLQGSVPAFLGALSENAVAFAVNGILKRYLTQDNQMVFTYSLTHNVMFKLTHLLTHLGNVIVLHWWLHWILHRVRSLSLRRY